MTSGAARSPRHVLECELSPRLPGAHVRAAMAAFYRTETGYARQQISHGAGYFSRLLGVMDAVLPERSPRLLEIGAGSGGALREFIRTHPRASGVALELSATSLDASLAGRPPSMRVVAADALQLPFADGSFDAAVAFEVVEHLPDVARGFDELLRVVRSRGHIIIGLPNHASLWTPIEDWVRGRDRLAFGVRAGRGVWPWLKRNLRLAWRKRLSGDAEFLYREPILTGVAGGDADAVYYAAPIDLLRFFRRRGLALVSSSAEVRLGAIGRWVPVELQGSTVMAWRVP